MQSCRKSCQHPYKQAVPWLCDCGFTQGVIDVQPMNKSTHKLGTPLSSTMAPFAAYVAGVVDGGGGVAAVVGYVGVV